MNQLAFDTALTGFNLETRMKKIAAQVDCRLSLDASLSRTLKIGTRDFNKGLTYFKLLDEPN